MGSGHRSFVRAHSWARVRIRAKRPRCYRLLPTHQCLWVQSRHRGDATRCRHRYTPGLDVVEPYEVLFSVSNCGCGLRLRGVVRVDCRTGIRSTQSDWSRNREPCASRRDALDCFMGLQRSRVDDSWEGSSHLTWIHSRLRSVIANDKSACVCFFVHLQVDVKPA